MAVVGAAAGTVTMSDAVRAQLQEAMKRGYVAAFRWLGNRDDSRDACQEAAARALSAEDRYDPSRPFYPWFYRILKNHCVDRLKSRQRTTTESRQLEIARAANESAEGMLVHSERARAVARAIAELPDELREIIELRHFQDASYDEIADILACPIGTVMSRLYRARKVLRNKLRADPDFIPAQPSGGPRP